MQFSGAKLVKGVFADHEIVQGEAREFKFVRCNNAVVAEINGLVYDSFLVDIW